MKRLHCILLSMILLLLVAFPLFAAKTNLLISGIKYGQAEGGGVEALQEVRILDSSSSEIGIGSVEIPVTARSASEDGIIAFSWVFNGNQFKVATLHFNITPFTCTYTDSNEVEQTSYLPFSMHFECSDTKVGNFTIPYRSSDNPLGNNGFKLTIGDKDYVYEYSDSITAMTGISNGPASIAAATCDLSWDTSATGSKDFYVTYNMSLFSAVSKDGTALTSGNYPDLCNHWNRRGTAYIKLDINADGTYTVGGTTYTIEPGSYVSTVTISFSAP
jgi:hypothetical protein